MCDAVSITLAITSAALAAGGTAASIHSANKTADAQTESARVAAGADIAASQTQAEQIRDQSQAEGLALKRASLLERGRLIAAQSETGFFGNSPLRELQNQRTQEAEALGTINQNQANALIQNQAGIAKIDATARGRINEARAGSVAPWLAALQIGSSGLQGGVQGAVAGRSLKRG